MSQQSSQPLCTRNLPRDFPIKIIQFWQVICSNSAQPVAPPSGRLYLDVPRDDFRDAALEGQFKLTLDICKDLFEAMWSA